MIGAAAVASAAVAAEPSWIMFSSEGPDCYADGSQVLDGEVYALVHSKDGVFKGLTFDGNLVDAKNDTIVGRAAIAKDYGCPPVMFILDNGNQDLSADGFGVYLFDTRYTAEDGKTTVAERVAGTGKFVSFNGYQKVNATVTTKAVANVAEKDALTGVGAVASVLPADVKQPKVTSITPDAGQVVVGVTDTLTGLRYTIKGGAEVGKIENTLVDSVNGVGEGKVLNLVIDDPKDNRFFKVVRGK
jgi:hypothetical protein